jgi:hypothetical protein
MSTHEELLIQLNKITEECKKLQQINKLSKELQDICDLLDKDKNVLLIKFKNEAFLSDAEKETILSNGVKYTSAMQKLQALIVEN